jgi:hypothetical protein
LDGVENWEKPVAGDITGKTADPAEARDRLLKEVRLLGI